MKVKIIDWYIGKQVFMILLASVFFFLSLEFILTFTFELQELKGNYKIVDAFFYLLYTTPRRFVDLLPLALLSGAMISMGILAKHNELDVLRAAGVSVARILLAACYPILIWIALGVFVSETLVPKTEQLARSERAIKRNVGKEPNFDDGDWYREGNLFAHIQAVKPGGFIYGISRYWFDDNHKIVKADYAKTGQHIEEGNWLLSDIERTFYHKSHTDVEEVETEEWDIKVTPEKLSVLTIKPEHMSLLSLNDYTEYLQEQGRDAKAFWYAFWKKLFQPLNTLTLVFIVVIGVFGPMRSVDLTQRISTGIIITVLLYYTQVFFGHASVVYNIPAFISAFLPCALLMGLAVYIYFKKIH